MDGNAVDAGPRRRYACGRQALFADEGGARRFETALLRLRELTAGASTPRVSAATEMDATTVTMSGVDRWDAYLSDCRRMIGASLADLAFGTVKLGLPQPPESRWMVSAVAATGDTDDERLREVAEGEDPA